MTTNRKIAKISALLMLIAVIGNVFSMLKEMLVASTFGLSGQMDAFYAALAIPNFISGIIGTLLSAMFIPLYAATKQTERDKIISSIINWALLISLVFVLAITLAPTFFTNIFFHGFSHESAAASASLLRQLNWTILLSAATGIMIGLLNAKEIFALPAASAMAITFCTTGLIIYFHKQLGIYALSCGLIGGMMIQLCLLWREIRRSDFLYSFSLDLSHPQVKETLAAAGIFLPAVLLNQISFFMSQILASWLPGGSVSAMGYAGKLLQLPMTVYTSAIVTAVFPYFAKQVAEHDMDGLAYSAARSIRMTAYVFIPFTLLNVVFAAPVIKLLFERGKFDAAATDLIAQTFILYAPQLFFNTAGMILSRIYFAFKGLKIFLKINLLMLPLNLLLSVVLMKLIRPPVTGLALATSLSFAANFFLVYLDLRTKLDHLDGKYIVNGIAKSFAAGLTATVTAFIAFKVSPLLFSGNFAQIGIAAAVALATVMAVSQLLHIEEYASIVKIAKEKIIRIYQ